MPWKLNIRNSFLVWFYRAKDFLVIYFIVDGNNLTLNTLECYAFHPGSSSRWDATTNLPFHIYNIFVAQITKLKPSEHNSLHGQVRPHWQLRDLQFNTACQSDLFRFIYFCRTSDEWNLTEARGKIERKWQWISEINKQTKKWRICFCEGSAMPQSRTESNILRLRKHVTCVSGVHIARTNEHETRFQCLCFSHKQRVETGKEPKYGFCFPW